MYAKLLVCNVMLQLKQYANDAVNLNNIWEEEEIERKNEFCK